MALEPLAVPEPIPIQATHADVDKTEMILNVPLTDVNGVRATSGAISVRIVKADLDPLTGQQKLQLRAIVVDLLKLKGILPP